jgi:uncharacterized protein YbjT (DUF2867 family)
MKKVLVAGATGYLGRYVIKELKKQGFWVRALARNSKMVVDPGGDIDEVFEGDVTNPETLSGILNGIDYVISSIGITRQKDGFTYMDVDYRGNKNLLDIAIKTNVSKFIFVSVINAHLLSELKIIQAKERFVDELKASKLDYAVIRPAGFFSDMLEFLDMAEKGKVYLFGDGENEINPIHGRDLAEICVDAIYEKETDITVGGPVVYTYKEIAELAFKIAEKKVSISSIPEWMIRIILPFMRRLTSPKRYGPIEFMMKVTTMDVIGELYGKERLENHFQKNYARH